MGGDLNNIAAANESHSASTYPRHLIRGFRQALLDCDLVDLGFNGSKYTWRVGSKRFPLDRVCATREWIELFLNFQVEVLAHAASDHSPLLLSLIDPRSRKFGSKNKFRFEEFWLQKEGCEELVVAEWNSLGKEVSAEEKLSSVAESLLKWNREVVGNLHQQVKECQEKFNYIRSLPPEPYLDQMEDKFRKS